MGGGGLNPPAPNIFSSLSDICFMQKKSFIRAPPLEIVMSHTRNC